MSSVISVPRENVAAGIGWMLFTGLWFVTMDTVGKYLLQSYPVMQVVWCRFLLHLLIALAVALIWFRDTLRSNRPWAQLGRSALLAVTTVLFYIGLATSDLATATTIMFMSPIFVTILSVPLLGESVGIRRMAGVLVGFLGAVIVVRPGIAPISTGMLCLLASASTNALFQISTRYLRHHDKPMTTSLYTALAGTILLSATGPFHWQTPDTQGWALLVALGFIGGMGQLCLIRALRLAPPAAIAPFSYASIVWATVFSLTVFGQVPSVWTLAGATLIIGSGLYIFRRERAAARAEIMAEPT
ncbi:MAG: DMT family transporter [Parvibaculaceae bacterium]